ncbi:prepilin-type N-terminal cleavage/methylation domain-containing protein [Ezakiella peruensis]|uniref:prepilin-type N-terminal cleavage/methylation domain-containing protein n=1 Tax=Ezakiella peruensis TaxID=1464038 RepID=UPI000C1B573E|nr:prepilin-type N-terminal cleavage/methylation domain-containing protein [Ezakiella peruensis]
MIRQKKKKNGFTLLELLIVILVVSISFSSIAFCLNSINKKQKDLYTNNAELLNIENYIYQCQANGSIEATDLYNISLINSFNNIRTYKLDYNKDGKDFEICFSIKEK